ncbi:MAG: hydroxymethylglutaryl-CoA reductase, degradative [Anaerolineae bacterium]|nr:hydroxymethylglutaryl-CoA reductase, degradative [Anaerolineae bacterium]
MENQRSSRLPGFYQKSLPERIGIIAKWVGLSQAEQAILENATGLSPQQVNQMVENALGVYGLPLGVATNFQINGKDYLIPMVIEEPSVVAACSFAARMARSGGGFTTSSDEPVMIGQIQVLDVENLQVAADQILAERESLLALVNDPDLTIIKLGGGGRDIEVRQFRQTTIGPMLVVDLLYDTRDAMGANAINTACEKLAPAIERITGGRVNLRILSNLSDRRKATASCLMTTEALTTKNMPGALVAKSIVEAAVFAEVDPYRATTHNKGVMNGVDAVVIATGNDWRAVEAGAHAYAARDGRYTSMTRWWQDENGNLRGMLTLPMAVGTVGGATKVHPTAQIAMKILGVSSARELAEVIVSVGLAQNFAAIRALATEGIQAGHMALHARQLALAAGAQGEMVNRIVETMIAEGNIRLDRAKSLVKAVLDKPNLA